MSRKGKTKDWHHRQANDPYVKQAKLAGYRSRAAIKLLELQEKYQLIRTGDAIVDLGAAPGGWSQVAKNLVGAEGRVYAIDRLEMAEISGVTFIQGDLEDELMFDRVCSENQFGVNLVISDMAPNLTGIPVTDQARMIALADLALLVASRVLKPGGGFLIKLFHGSGFDEYRKSLLGYFPKVSICKPKSSRRESHEVYCFAKGYTE